MKFIFCKQSLCQLFVVEISVSNKSTLYTRWQRYINHHQVLFQATWPTHIIHTKTHNAHKNTKNQRKHIKHTKEKKINMKMPLINSLMGYDTPETEPTNNKT